MPMNACLARGMWYVNTDLYNRKAIFILKTSLHIISSTEILKMQVRVVTFQNHSLGWERLNWLSVQRSSNAPETYTPSSLNQLERGVLPKVCVYLIFLNKHYRMQGRVWGFLGHIFSRKSTLIRHFSPPIHNKNNIYWVVTTCQAGPLRSLYSKLSPPMDPVREVHSDYIFHR